MPLSPIIERPFDIICSIATQMQVPTYNRDGTMVLNQNNEPVTVTLITQSEVDAIKGLSGYVSRPGLFGMIATVLHRVWNAVKAIFGMSDWQQAHAAFSSYAPRITPLTALFGNPRAKIEEALLKQSRPEYSNEVSLGMEAIVKGISEVNEVFEPLEPMLGPFLDQLAAAVNGANIANDFFNFPQVMAEIGQNMPQGEIKLARVLPNFVNMFINRGYLKQEIMPAIHQLIDTPVIAAFDVLIEAATKKANGV